jgi:hypothetical protein
MSLLKREFLLGFQQGWQGMMSPFAALFNSLREVWAARSA